jgi:hypothetical protein
MKTRPDALGTTENESGSAKHENGTRLHRYRLKRVRGAKYENRTPSVKPKKCPGAKKFKKGPDAPGTTAENESGGAKTRKRNSTPPVPPKTSPGEQNMKTGPDALGTAENKFGSAKHENGKGRPRYRPKRVRENNT